MVFFLSYCKPDPGQHFVTCQSIGMRFVVLHAGPSIAVGVHTIAWQAGLCKATKSCTCIKLPSAGLYSDYQDGIGLAYYAGWQKKEILEQARLASC